MAFSTINKGSSFMNTKLFTGTGASNAITGVGFQPDFTWIKNRPATDFHVLTDAVRGVTKYLQSNSTAIPVTNAESLKSFDSDGFTVGTMNEVNTNTEDFASWNWKAGTTSGIATNGSTTITPSAYSFSQTAGISILKFTGNKLAGAKLAHGLGVVPEMVFFKTLEGVSLWGGYNKTITATDYIKLNETAAATSYALAFANTEPDAVNITLGSWEAVNGNVGMEEMVAYAFASVQGYSKIGYYWGNGQSSDGTFVYTGFRPACVIVKKYSGTEDWFIWDNKRQGYNPDNEYLFPDLSNVEGTANRIDLLSNGFKARTSDGGNNGSGDEYLYLAFAESPLVNSEGVPGNAR